MTIRSFLDGKVILYPGDSREVMASLPDCSVDSIVTDPPYGIGFMGKKWDTPGALVERKAATENKWDHVGGNHNPTNSRDAARTARVEGQKFGKWCEEWAREALRVLKPGGHIVAFSGTRTYHRLACGIEDAGFEIRDQAAWAYGTGFNKVGYIRDRDGEIVKDGWGGSLKPAWEPIALARKPLIGTVAENLSKFGTGALNIDGCRIPSDGGAVREGEASQDRRYNERGSTNFAAKPGPRGGAPEGRWPANLLHDGSPEVVAAFPDAPGQQRPLHGGEPSKAEIYGKYGPKLAHTPRGDSGSAARFFYAAKADADDRIGSKHPTVKPLDLMQYLVRLVTPRGGTVLDPFAGTGTTGEAAWREGMKAILIERESEYQEDIARRMDLATKPTKRAAVVKTKNKIDDHGPLFAESE